jgi:hypothetical protein
MSKHEKAKRAKENNALILIIYFLGHPLKLRMTSTIYCQQFH